MAIRTARRVARRPSEQAQATLANALLWDVILALGPKIGGWPVVKFKGAYYLVDYGNPWPAAGRVCRLLAKTGPNLAVTPDGLVSAWLLKPRARWLRKPTIYGIQDEIEPVLALPVAGSKPVTRAERAAVPGAGAGADEQLPGRNSRTGSGW